MPVIVHHCQFVPTLDSNASDIIVVSTHFEPVYQQEICGSFYIVNQVHRIFGCSKIQRQVVLGRTLHDDIIVPTATSTPNDADAIFEHVAPSSPQEICGNCCITNSAKHISGQSNIKRQFITDVLLEDQFFPTSDSTPRHVSVINEHAELPIRYQELRGTCHIQNRAKYIFGHARIKSFQTITETVYYVGRTKIRNPLVFEKGLQKSPIKTNTELALQWLKGKVRIHLRPILHFFGVANIFGITTHNQIGQCCFRITVEQDQNGNSRITVLRIKQQNGFANVFNKTTRKQYGLVRITNLSEQKLNGQ